MLTIKNIYSTLMLLTLMISTVAAQDTLRNKLEILARAQPDQVLLRWAPSTPMAWYYGNKYGMKLERYTILRNGKTLSTPEKKTIDKVFKPLPMADWEAVSKDNDYALVAAQAIYGESFDVTENFSSDLAKALSKTKEMEQRHLFALFAADQSRDVARAAGLFYEDKEVKAGEKYLYSIVPLTPPAVLKIDTGFAYVSLSDYFELPAPEGLQAECKDSVAMVSWEGKRFQHFYNSFILERSADKGKTFQSVTDLPIVSPMKEDGQYPDYIFKADSLKEVSIKYVYRVRGINPFGEISPPSDTASVLCKPTLRYTPRILESLLGKEGSMLVRWEFPKEGISHIKGFKLKRAGQIKGELKEIRSNLQPGDTVAIDPQPLNSNYYTVVAFDAYGNESSSMPFLAMLEDSIAPAIPDGLKGKIDSMGIVTLTWNKNKEPDLQSYRIYRSSFADKEFVQITARSLKEATYTDTVEIKTLTREVYYKVLAMDGHFNSSNFSQVLKIERPDVVPPVPPQMTQIDTDDKGIHLTWTNSSSKDVAHYVLYRRSSVESGWRILKKINASEGITGWTDSSATPGETYAYTMIAVDRSGLESAPCRPVSRQRVNVSNYPDIREVKVKADRSNNLINISWNYDASGVYKYLIYRAEEKGALVLYKEIKATSSSFDDAALKSNTVYKYHVQAKFENGGLSPLSKELIINY